MGSKRLIQDQRQIEEILSKAKFLRLALSDADTPDIFRWHLGIKATASISTTLRNLTWFPYIPQ